MGASTPVVTRLSGWGNWPTGTTEILRPERFEDVSAALAERPVLAPRGLGRSYGDAAFRSGGVTLVTEGLATIHGVDPERGVVDADAGVSLDQLLAVLLPMGLFPAVVPGTRFVTLGGMVAADVHGKNHHVDGATARQVVDLDLRLPSGERVTLSPDRDPALWWATFGGMGLTGVVERVRLRVHPVPSGWLSVDVDRTDDFEGALALFESDADYRYSVAWIDCLAKGARLGRSVLLRGNWRPADALTGRAARRAYDPPRPLPLAAPFPAPSGLLNRATVAAFNAAYYAKHPRQARARPLDYRRFFFPLDAVHRWNRLYGRKGFLQYQCVLPEDRGAEGLRRLLETLSGAGAASFLAVLKRFGPGESGQLLSFPRAGYTLALDLPMRGTGTLELCEALDRIVLDHGGRLYLAKDARMRPETFRAMYPEAERFLEVKRRVDPDGRLATDLSRRLGLTG